MGSPEDCSEHVRARRLALGAALAVGTLACLGLIGWATSATWGRFLRGDPEMMPNTAVTLLLAALSLGLHQGCAFPVWRRTAGALSAVLVAGVGALTLSEYLFGTNLGLDTWLFTKRAAAFGESLPGRPSYYTAVAFLLVGGALLWAYFESRYDHLISQTLAVGAGLVAGLALEGYVIRYPAFYRAGSGAGMAVYTALSILLLAAGSVLTFPDRGIMRLLASRGPGGLTARRLLPLPFVLSFILSWLALAGNRAGLYDQNVGDWLLQLSRIVVFTVLILVTVWGIERADRHRRQAEEALRESQGRYQSLFDFAPYPALVYDVGTLRFLAVNRAAIRTYGYSMAEFLSRSMQDIWPPDDAPVLLGELSEARDGELVFGSRRHVKKNGTIIDVQAASCTVALSGRRARLVLAEDITERKRLEGERQRYQAEIESQNRELEVRRQEAVRVMRMKSDFLAEMTHELRTPLNAIMGFSDLLTASRTDTLSERQRRHIAHVRSASVHLLAIVNDMLELSRIEAGVLEFRREPVVVAEVLSEVLTSVTSLALRKSVRIESEVSGDWTVQGDRKRLKQILYNLVGNAIKFTPAGGMVRVRAGAEGDFLRFSVNDTGIGIRPDDQAVIFEPFRRAKDAAEMHEGTGLGLAITKQLVERQGGRIWVESELHRGSTFSFTLPIQGRVEAEAVS